MPQPRHDWSIISHRFFFLLYSSVALSLFFLLSLSLSSIRWRRDKRSSDTRSLKRFERKIDSLFASLLFRWLRDLLYFPWRELSFFIYYDYLFKFWVLNEFLFLMLIRILWIFVSLRFRFVCLYTIFNYLASAWLSRSLTDIWNGLKIYAFILFFILLCLSS